ncbi:outer envelope protein [Trifolium repens]|nr:outer envelope protein [Trifolium repens]
MSVVTRSQARNPLCRALLVASNYRGPDIDDSRFAVTDAYLFKRYLIEKRKYEERNVLVWTPEPPNGIFANVDPPVTLTTETMISSHLITLLREDFSRPGDTVLLFISTHQASTASEPSVILSRANDGTTNLLSASTLRNIVRLVPAGVYFSVILHSCGSPGMVGWSKFQFSFDYNPLVRPELSTHTANELVVTFTSSSSADEAGEERFSIEIDENNQVWYEILSFSKPAHILSFVGYPYVMLRQKYFAHESAKVMLKHINSSKS